ncbi:outer membrane protein assembly factor BamC [mine drainage metagenome]|uniref:Outer membrane protein assembly factor BamC n=1 Tax=mine drainage metagenome TaxID=410659 RepID=A0A1J5QX81_9ZZZZ
MRLACTRPLLRLSSLALALAAAGALSGCSSFDHVVSGSGVDYQSAKAGPDLAVPPDLTQLTRDQQYTMPAGGQSASARAYQSGTAPQAAAQRAPERVLPEFAGMHIEQAGALRWLVVDEPPQALWDKVAAFWQRNGFYLTRNEPASGVMETNWAENRAKLPQDFIRRTLGKVFDSVYDTGERDRYRTVFERTPDGRGTQIIVTHQTMVEVYSSNDKTQTMWQPGTPDPTLDGIFVRRLMVSLGMKDEQAKAAWDAPTPAPGQVHATLVDGGRALHLPDAPEQAWRRVDLAINTAGFTVTGRDRNSGTFDVRYISPEASLKAAQAGEGLLGKLFGHKDKAPQPAAYRIVLQAADGGSQLTVQPVASNSDAARSSAEILKVLQQQLR